MLHLRHDFFNEELDGQDVRVAHLGNGRVVEWSDAVHVVLVWRERIEDLDQLMGLFSLSQSNLALLNEVLLKAELHTEFFFSQLVQRKRS